MLCEQGGLVGSLHTQSLRDPGWCCLHCFIATPSGLFHCWRQSQQQLYALVWNVTCHSRSTVYWWEPITWPWRGWDCIISHGPQRIRKPDLCAQSNLHQNDSLFFFLSKKRTKGLYCCLIPSNLGTEQKTCFWQNPIYTRPRVLFVTNQRKWYCMLGVVKVGNLYFKKICEK